MPYFFPTSHPNGAEEKWQKYRYPPASELGVQHSIAGRIIHHTIVTQETEENKIVELLMQGQKQ